MSHLQGTDYVGSMVVMEDGLPKRSDYRRFKVNAVPGTTTTAAMDEVLTRRLRASTRRPGEAATERPTRFAYPPQLLLIDGGKGQLGGRRARSSTRSASRRRLPIASLAKQFEEVFVPGRADPIRIPRDSEAIYLLQQIRDEAHRFAITFHRELRAKRMTSGALDDVARPRAEAAEPRLVARARRRRGSVRGEPRAQLRRPLELVARRWLPATVLRPSARPATARRRSARR